MRIHKKEGKGIRFGELVPVLYHDQQITIDTFRKLDKEFREGKRKRRLTEEERLNIYILNERQRFKSEKEKIRKLTNKIFTFISIIIIFILILTYRFIPDLSLFFSIVMFNIEVWVGVYLYLKQYNIFDKLRERDLYLAILDIKKNINDLHNLIENINKKTKM